MDQNKPSEESLFWSLLDGSIPITDFLNSIFHEHYVFTLLISSNDNTMISTLAIRDKRAILPFIAFKQCIYDSIHILSSQSSMFPSSFFKKLSYNRLFLICSILFMNKPKLQLNNIINF